MQPAWGKENCERITASKAASNKRPNDNGQKQPANDPENLPNVAGNDRTIKMLHTLVLLITFNVFEQDTSAHGHSLKRFICC